MTISHALGSKFIRQESLRFQLAAAPKWWWKTVCLSPPFIKKHIKAPSNLADTLGAVITLWPARPYTNRLQTDTVSYYRDDTLVWWVSTNGALTCCCLLLKAAELDAKALELTGLCSVDWSSNCGESEGLIVFIVVLCSCVCSSTTFAKRGRGQLQSQRYYSDQRKKWRGRGFSLRQTAMPL